MAQHTFAWEQHYLVKEIMLNKKIQVLKSDTAKSLAERVLRIEHDMYPEVVKALYVINFQGNVNKALPFITFLCIQRQIAVLLILTTQHIDQYAKRIPLRFTTFSY